MTRKLIEPIRTATASGTPQSPCSMTWKIFSRRPTPAKLIGNDEIVRSIGMIAKKSITATRARKA